jgi:Phosphate-selective porin O and P
MKNIVLIYFIILLPLISFGQKEQESQAYTPLIPTSKTSLLKEVDVIFNTRLALDNYFTDGDFTKSQFSANELRLEIKGKIHDKVYFRFRNRYSKTPEPATIDNVYRSVDLAHLIIDLSPKSKLTLGKMIGDWAGYELLLNPIEVLSFNTVIQKSDLFLVGAAYSYSMPEIKSKFNFQVLNSRTKTFQEQYGAAAPPLVIETKTPLAAVANWKGFLFEGQLETSYSYAYFIDAENKGRNYITLGNKFKNKNFVLYYDFQYSTEDLDTKLVVSNIIKPQQSDAAQDVTYVEHWLRAEYKIKPNLNLLLTVMNHNSYWNGNPDPDKSSNLLTSYGIIPTIEYTPFSDLNMKFYLGYVGNKYDYSSYAETTFGAIDYRCSRISFGIIAPILVL